MASITTDATLKVCPRDEAIPTARIVIIEGESLPPELANLPFRDRMPDPPTDKEKERRKGKAAIMKMARKSGHHMLAHLKRGNCLEAELLKVRKDLQVEINHLQVRKDLQVEINHLQVMTVKAKHLVGEKMVESKVAWRFPKLDLSFLKEEEEIGDKAGLSSTGANLFSVEPTVEVPEPTSEVPKPIESVPTSPTTTPPEVVDLE
ncbi:hypothetical protein COCNU_04G008010 [Cocos nucifera]|uniref:Uncharacterized protein n=1 Tax=Cocos nucifera TaxID=13894 RepID=A0A8K0MZW5_COCNU|nr:hypothetical protein COCNU_04G008010 [Cocos nucifera]